MGVLWQLQVASVYIGAVLGAGFASGQEIMQFFVRYGSDGPSAVVLSGVLFGILGPAVLVLCRQRSFFQYQDLLNYLFGQKLGKVMDLIIAISLFSGLMVMLSGTGALVSQQWGWPYWLGVSLTAIGVFFSLWGGLKGLLWVNTFLVPIKALICVAVAGGVLLLSPSIESVPTEWQGYVDVFAGYHNPNLDSASTTESFGLLPSSAAFGAFLYVSFNLAMSMVVLVALTPQVKKQGGYQGAAVGGLLLGLFAYVLTLAMLQYVPEIEAYPVPMLFLASTLHPWTGHIYAFLLWLAMFTAALGSAFGAALRISKEKKGKKFQKALFFSIVSVAPFSLLPFADLVATLYPIFGYIGLPIIAAIAWSVGRDWWRKKWSEQDAKIGS
ncbi:hypothetical protein F9B85_04695 [Heliorestis acidaminivorans]|uniref:GerAB/ArcD/ProY family transporter n=1 Tax=Heliorestis acidaminivorans TaxID=553427 RepID=A0A6I0F5F9_9FIRM|nr:hypothetical protein [Heliorestis acidaminivorans]KAB2953907.1 hypothetical protein F9B85_04695 [Heliorestis acidaminivorans]